MLSDSMHEFNKVPKEIREDGESNKEENKLAQYIRKHKGKLHKETLALLNNLPGEDTYSWCKDMRSAKQRLEETLKTSTATGSFVEELTSCFPIPRELCSWKSDMRRLFRTQRRNQRKQCYQRNVCWIGG